MGGNLSVWNGWVSAAVLRMERCNHSQLCTASLVIIPLHSGEMDVCSAVYSGGSLHGLDTVWLWLVPFRSSWNGCGGTVSPEACGEKPAGKVDYVYDGTVEKCMDGMAGLYGGREAGGFAAGSSVVFMADWKGEEAGDPGALFVPGGILLYIARSCGISDAVSDKIL